MTELDPMTEDSSAHDADQALRTYLDAQAAQDLLPIPNYNHKESKSQLLALLTGGDPVALGADSLRALARRNEELLKGGIESIKEALADQVTILEAVSTRFIGEAVLSRSRPGKAQALAQIGLKASDSLLRTLVALHRINEDKANDDAFTG